MNRRTPLWLALVIVSVGVALPIVPRLVVPLLRPFAYDDPYLGAGIVGIGPLVVWNALPFLLLATVAYVWLTRAARSPRHYAMGIGGVAGALVPGIVVGLWIHTPSPAVVGANIGAGLFPLYMVVIMPVGFGLGALLARLVWGRGASSPTGTLGT